MMDIRVFDPLRHAEGVFSLWEQALGDTYPVDRETFLAHVLASTLGRPAGALVAVADETPVGFVLVAANGETGFVEVLLVKPDAHRQGIGRALLGQAEQSLSAEGCRKVWLGRGPNRFWTGLPEDLPVAAAFFKATGYAPQNQVSDLVIDLREERPVRYRERLADAGAEVVPCTREMLAAVLAFEQREFPGWVSGILRLAAQGEERQVLVVRIGDEIVGTIQTFAPDSRTLGANLAWRAAFPGALGGYGAVGIAKSRRGSGLGIAMCEAAGLAVRAQGADFCFIDWTTIVDFYARVGARVWRTFTMASKDLHV